MSRIFTLVKVWNVWPWKLRWWSHNDLIRRRISNWDDGRTMVAFDGGYQIEMMVAQWSHWMADIKLRWWSRNGLIRRRISNWDDGRASYSTADINLHKSHGLAFSPPSTVFQHFKYSNPGNIGQGCECSMANINLYKSAFICLHICHRIAPVRNLFSVMFTYFFMIKIANNQSRYF